MNLPGATYSEAFIDKAEEEAIVDWLDTLVWDESFKRRVQHFGYRYDYNAKNVSPDTYLGSLPDKLMLFGQRLVDFDFLSKLPNQVIVNEYWPGQGISAHIDCVPCFDDTIVSISLLSQCEMVFANKMEDLSRQITLERRSALILRNEARYEWTHAIPARKSDTVDGVKVPRDRRISLTFRRVIV